MNRRQLLVGLGGIAGGGGIATGTGAFTSVDADRVAQVEVAGDQTGYLRIFPTPNTANGAFAATTTASTGNQLQLDFNDEIPDPPNPSGGEGVGVDSEYVFDDVFRIENRGTQEVYVDITPLIDVSLQDAGNDGTQGDVTLEFFAKDSSGNREVIDGSTAELTVPVGTVRAVGVEINTDDESTYGNINSPLDSNQTSGETTTVNADNTVDSGNAIDPGSP